MFTDNPIQFEPIYFYKFHNAFILELKKSNGMRFFGRNIQIYAANQTRDKSLVDKLRETGLVTLLCINQTVE